MYKQLLHQRKAHTDRGVGIVLTRATHRTREKIEKGTDLHFAEVRP